MRGEEEAGDGRRSPAIPPTSTGRNPPATSPQTRCRERAPAETSLPAPRARLRPRARRPLAGFERRGVAGAGEQDMRKQASRRAAKQQSSKAGKQGGLIKGEMRYSPRHVSGGGHVAAQRVRPLPDGARVGAWGATGSDDHLPSHTHDTTGQCAGKGAGYGGMARSR